MIIKQISRKEKRLLKSRQKDPPFYPLHNRPYLSVPIPPARFRAVSFKGLCINLHFAVVIAVSKFCTVY